MIIDTATLFAIRQRMEAAAKPLLFHEERTPSRQARRVQRIMRWLGPEGREATKMMLIDSRYRTRVADDERKWERGGRVR